MWKPVIAHLNGEVVKALRAPEIKEQLVSEGSVPVGSSPDEAARFLASEIAR